MTKKDQASILIESDKEGRLFTLYHFNPDIPKAPHEMTDEDIKKLPAAHRAIFMLMQITNTVMQYYNLNPCDGDCENCTFYKEQCEGQDDPVEFELKKRPKVDGYA